MHCEIITFYVLRFTHDVFAKGNTAVDITDTEGLLEQRERLRVSEHALREAHKEGLRVKEVLHAIFNGIIVEQYPERKRVLIAGPVPGEPLPVQSSAITPTAPRSSPSPSTSPTGPTGLRSRCAGCSARRNSAAPPSTTCGNVDFDFSQ